jgi:phosphoenolpyruvate phosphomutase
MMLRERLSTPEGLIRLAGAHNVMEAKLAAAAGFEGVWASGFEIATAVGVPDSDALGWQELLPEAARMAAAVDVPVVADCGTGFGDCHAIVEIAQAYENVGVAGSCGGSTCERSSDSGTD